MRVCFRNELVSHVMVNFWVGMLVWSELNKRGDKISCREVSGVSNELFCAVQQIIGERSLDLN